MASRVWSSAHGITPTTSGNPSPSPSSASLLVSQFSLGRRIPTRCELDGRTCVESSRVAQTASQATVLNCSLLCCPGISAEPIACGAVSSHADGDSHCRVASCNCATATRTSISPDIISPRTLFSGEEKQLARTLRKQRNDP